RAPPRCFVAHAIASGWRACCAAGSPGAVEATCNRLLKKSDLCFDRWYVGWYISARPVRFSAQLSLPVPLASAAIARDLTVMIIADGRVLRAYALLAASVSIPSPAS